MLDKSSFSGRVKRYTQVTKELTPLALRFFMGKFSHMDKSSFSQHLKENIGSLKGPIMKIAQMTASIPGMLDDECAQALRELQSHAPPMGPLFVRRRMRKELGHEWRRFFHSFNMEPCAAASLGQVHKAVTTEGNVVACKLQYPDMISVVDADISQFNALMSWYQKRQKGLVMDNILLEIRDRLYEELDYSLEQKRMNMFRYALPMVTIPKAYPHLSTRQLLTMSYEKGVPLLAYKDSPQELRDSLAAQLFTAWYKPLYTYGILHGDPHFGNYGVKDNTSLIIYDFGCVRVFSPSFIGGILLLYQALKEKDEDKMYAAYTKWGFDKISKDTFSLLNLWASYLYEPVLDDKKRYIQEDLTIEEGKRIAQHILASLQKDGYIRPPREFVLLDRAAVGIGSLCLHLKAKVNWSALFYELTKDFSEKNLKEQQDTLNIMSENDFREDR